MIESDEEQGRGLSRLVVLRAGRLVTTGDAHEPYQVVGPGGGIVEPVSVSCGTCWRQGSRNRR